MAEKKLTKTEKFMEIKGILQDVEAREELIELIDKEIEAIARKSASKKKTANQQANEEIKQIIIQKLKNIGQPVTITELLNTNTDLKELTGGSNQKVSALMTQLKDSNAVIRSEIKGRAYFTVAE